MCVCVCVFVFGLFIYHIVGYKKQEPTIPVGSDSIVGTKLLDPASVNDRFRVKTWF